MQTVEKKSQNIRRAYFALVSEDYWVSPRSFSSSSGHHESANVCFLPDVGAVVQSWHHTVLITPNMLTSSPLYSVHGYTLDMAGVAHSMKFALSK